MKTSVCERSEPPKLRYSFIRVWVFVHPHVHACDGKYGNLLRCYLYQVPGLLKEDMVLPDSDEDL